MASQKFTLAHLVVLLLCNRFLSLRNFNIIKHTRFSVVNNLRSAQTRKVFAVQASEGATPTNRRGIIKTVGSFFSRLNNIVAVEKRDVEVVIVGAGIAGLSCAKSLVESGLIGSVLILEAESKAGGRVGTDQVEGYLLDRGFQVMLSPYVLSVACVLIITCTMAWYHVCTVCVSPNQVMNLYVDRIAIVAISNPKYTFITCSFYYRRCTSGP